MSAVSARRAIRRSPRQSRRPGTQVGVGWAVDQRSPGRSRQSPPLPSPSISAATGDTSKRAVRVPTSRRRTWRSAGGDRRGRSRRLLRHRSPASAVDADPSMIGQSRAPVLSTTRTRSRASRMTTSSSTAAQCSPGASPRRLPRRSMPPPARSTAAWSPRRWLDAETAPVAGCRIDHVPGRLGEGVVEASPVTSTPSR